MMTLTLGVDGNEENRTNTCYRRHRRRRLQTCLHLLRMKDCFEI